MTVREYIKQGKAKFDQGEYKLALEYFQAAAEENPGDDSALLGIAKVYNALGRENDYKIALFECLAKNPDNKEANRLLKELNSPQKGSKKSRSSSDNNTISSAEQQSPIPPTNNSYSNNPQSQAITPPQKTPPQKNKSGCLIGVLGIVVLIGGMIGAVLVEEIEGLFYFPIAIGLIMLCVGIVELDSK